MVMVHKPLSRRRYFFRRLLEILREIPDPLRRTVLLRHCAKSDTVAAENVMFFDEPVRIVQNPIHIAVGQHDLQTVFVADLTHPLRTDFLSDRGNLHGGITHICNSLYRTREILFRLRIGPDRVKLCSSFHSI